MRIAVLISLIFFLQSCGNKKVETKNENGQILKTFYVDKNGEKEGPFITYYESGKIKEESNYSSGKLSGKRILYAENGNIEIEEIYTDTGVLHGPYKLYYPNGTLQLEKTYQDNIITGSIKVYYTSGQLKEEVSMSNNEENGPFTEYYENGKIHWKGIYRNGDNEYGVLYEYDSLGAPIKIMKCDTLAICRTVWKPGMPEIKIDTIKI
jgi:antitoxin component YwqK of YwqJK toxin-antitoxin module